MRQSAPDASKSVSVVVPVFNEKDNIDAGFTEIKDALEATDRKWEIIYVDDGSTDSTIELIKIHTTDPRVKLVQFRRNFGQTAAMHAGIQHASGDYIVTLDGDRQNVPADIPEMLVQLDAGYDLVHGWRHQRQDNLMRTLPSRIANALISKVTGYKINDLGCTLKAIKSEIAKELELYGEMHRFIPVLAYNLGADCLEIPVNHRPRVAGESKYGIGRTTRVLLDLITIQYMTKYFSSPMKFFGAIGFAVGGLAFLALAAALIMKIGWAADLTGNALTFLAIVCAILSGQFFSLGIIGELAVRIYYSTGRKQSYQVKELVNFDSLSDANATRNPQHLDHNGANPSKHEQSTVRETVSDALDAQQLR